MSVPGLIGICAFGESARNWNALRFAYYAMMSLQNRGQESFCVAWLDASDGKLEVASAEGRLEGLKELVESRRGHVAIGMTSPVRGDSISLIEGDVRLAVATDGMASGSTSRIETGEELGRRISSKLTEGLDLLSAAVKAVDSLPGGYAFVVLTERGELCCGRSNLGIKPLCVGGYGFDLGCVASESAALEVIGAEYRYDLRAGEVLAMDRNSLRRASTGSGVERPCAFELVYLSRHDSIVFGIEVARFREELGRALAEGDGVEADVVVGVPETSYPAAMAYSEAKGIPCKVGFVRTGNHVRSALRPTQLERLIGLQLKLNPVRSSVEGRRVVVVDDSVVRGNTLKHVVSALRRKGATEVHVRVCSPRLVDGCPFGTEVPPRDELIAGSLDEGTLSDVIGCDSLAFLDLSRLEKTASLIGTRFCTRCFGGNQEGDGL
ncbi:MAG: phosphoribosyltransferase family protein [Nitrososphaerota archaeon]